VDCRLQQLSIQIQEYFTRTSLQVCETLYDSGKNSNFPEETFGVKAPVYPRCMRG
jgi:hypothetical protein